MTTGATEGETPSQTVGPYYTMVLGVEPENLMWKAGVHGTRVLLTGRVLDGNRTHIEDALLDVWQADAEGRYTHPADRWPPVHPFGGFGRASTDFKTGVWTIDTIKPGPVADRDGRLHAPHCVVIVQSRGMLVPSFTRVYFSDEADRNGVDPVLGSVPVDRRQTLIAELDPTASGSIPTYRWDVRLQGDDETVFFDV